MGVASHPWGAEVHLLFNSAQVSQDCTTELYTVAPPIHCLPRSSNLKCRSLQLIEVSTHTEEEEEEEKKEESGGQISPEADGILVVEHTFFAISWRQGLKYLWNCTAHYCDHGITKAWYRTLSRLRKPKVSPVVRNRTTMFCSRVYYFVNNYQWFLCCWYCHMFLDLHLRSK